MRDIPIIEENFSDFSIGEFPCDKNHSAIGEYHYVVPEGYMGNWYDPMASYKWRSDGPTWIITETCGKMYMEQMRVPIEDGMFNDLWPMLVTGDALIRDFTMEAVLRMLSTSSHTGIIFRYVHSRRHYGICFYKQKLLIFKRNQDTVTELAAEDYSYNADECYTLKVECSGNKITGYVNGEKRIEAEDGDNECGRIGIMSRVPARFTGIRVTMNEIAYKEYNNAREELDKRLKVKRSGYPGPVLWKRIDFKDFGTARQIRFGHLTGTDEIYMVLAQHQKRVARDSYAFISCLTAVDLDGNVLWQKGKPGMPVENTRISADLPFQICDIDGDGVDEVIAVLDFKLCIMDGPTGKVKRFVPTPYVGNKDKASDHMYNREYAFDRLNADAVRIANFSGNSKPTDIVIKDRYSRVWAFDNQLNLLWEFKHGNTGHFPYTIDINGDGRDEMIIGYDMVSSTGELLWTLPIESDHTDEIIVARLNPDKEQETICMASGWEGFLMSDSNGNILKKQAVGHAQRISTGNYRKDLKGLEICLVTYWGSQGIIYFFDCDGNLLSEFEPGTNGNVLTPVNWTGDGSELILLNGSRYGGMMDGEGDRVVEFPEDGHPDLCAEVINITGDNRDEIILWDENGMYIYTQENERTSPDKEYNPSKYPHYNASNYRGEYSYTDQE